MKTLIHSEEIQKELDVLADTLNNKFVNKSDVVCVPILQGGVKFFVDLSNRFKFNPVVDYVGASSYHGEERRDIKAYKLPEPGLIANKTVLLFDDILESGQTMKFFTNLLFSFGAKEVIPVVLLKRADSKAELDPRIKKSYHCFSIGDSWVFGYGMDNEDGLFRCYPEVLCK